MKNFIEWHKKKYPLMQDDDILLLIFQSVYAGRFSFRTKKEVKSVLKAEFTSLNRSYQDLYTYINNSYVRINLTTYSKYKFSKTYLALSHYHSAKENKANKDLHAVVLETAGLKSDDLELKEHSPKYIEEYKPQYRIIDVKYLSQKAKDVQLLNFLEHQEKNTIIAIEGKCASGKTTIMRRIAKENISIIPIDDFFLPPSMKTTERLSEVGGNIDYDRILELLNEIKANKNSEITYEKYNCVTNEYSKVSIPRKDIIVLEGVYSYHPSFRHLIDKLVYLDVDNFTQNQRLKRRVNYDLYINTWIVLENIYYSHENIKFLADLIV